MDFGKLTASLVFLMLIVTSAASAASNDDWQSGKQAFEDGDFRSALVLFESARDRGVDGPAVHYNIAVSQFKLGDYDAAGKTFSLIAGRYPAMRGLAEYNLGLVARRLHQRQAAQQHFLRAYELSPGDRKIRELASRRLRELEPERRTASRWTGALGVRTGYDDNVALRDEAGLPSGVTTDSPMVDVFAAVQGPWNGRSGFRVEGSAYVVRYVDADEYDQSQFRGGAFYDWRPYGWRLRAGVHTSAGSLGGDAFDRSVGADARVMRYLGDNASAELRYTYDDISEGESLYAPIAGSRQQFDARFRWDGDGHGVLLRYWLETNDRADPAISPERQRVVAHYRYQPEAGIGYEVGIDLRNSDYDEIATPREEELLTFRTGLTYTFRNAWLVTLEYRKSDNESTDPLFAYDRTQLLLGVVRVF